MIERESRSRDETANGGIGGTDDDAIERRIERASASASESESERRRRARTARRDDGESGD